MNTRVGNEQTQIKENTGVTRFFESEKRAANCLLMDSGWLL